MKKIFYILIYLTCFSCKQNHTTKGTLVDTVIRNYLAMIDSSAKFDTSDFNYKALKAYFNYDTVFIRELDTYIKKEKTARENWNLWQSDIPLPKLNRLNADEAFRFIFSVFGGTTYEAITITQRDTVRKLHYLCYHHNKENASFERQKEFEKNINKKDWNEIIYKIQYADFWGLKSENHIRGDDGNDLTVIGYYRNGNIERSHYVHRWTHPSLSNAFYYIYYNLLNKNERLFGEK